MTDSHLQRMAVIAAAIREVVGCPIRCEQPGLRQYGKGAVLTLLHEPGEPLRPYCDYDCREYHKIEELEQALRPLGVFVEDCTGDYSAVYERGCQ